MDLKDDLGALVDGATITASVTGGGGSWSGTLTGVNGGIYGICNVGSFDGNSGGGVVVTFTASKANYQSVSGTINATAGNIYGCP